MRLGWTTGKYSTTYRAIKTIRVNGKNKTIIVKNFGSEKYICRTYGVTDAKAWAKEQVALMDKAEKEETATVFIEFSAARNLEPDQQLSMIPLEKKLLQNFDMSQFVICTDAGLSSSDNRKFNNFNDDESSRSFITTQSIKKMKGFLKTWTLDPSGWHLWGDTRVYHLDEIDEEKDKGKIFYKSRWITENGMEQQLIVTYSIKYRDYLRKIRDGQVKRALKKVKQGNSAVESKRQNDLRRFIRADHTTEAGEVADKIWYYVDDTAIKEEEKYDGFYAVCTNLEDNPEAIIKINKRRWEIEECFRIMKSEFEARPVYVQRKDRIQAHFITCFISLIIYRYLEKRLEEKYTCSQIIGTLQNMNFLRFDGKGYIPTYTRTELTDALHGVFGFTTSKEIIPAKKMKNICAQTKNPVA